MPQTDFIPKLMPSPAAAHYLGVSESKLRKLGIPRRELLSKQLYDRIDLDRYASTLPTEGEDTCDADQAFRASG